ncbi:MAG: hypothetical protein DRJ42_12160 [Deltaproteobacteria bacterium]|nr:MAG: hypothetical protein DRJ42_12160 [Deltaproteobacteria bacterium]
MSNSDNQDEDEVRIARFELDELELMVIDVPGSAPALDGLTTAERAVVMLALDGRSNKEIARDRDCSVKTVANQLRSSYQKLGVNSRFELAAKVLGTAGG